MNFVGRRRKGFLTVAEVERLLGWCGTNLESAIMRVKREKADNKATLENMKQEADNLSGQLTVVKEEIVVHTELDKEIDKVLSLLTWNEGEGENN